jgi:predicted Rossmann fold nucleotide-binding protein DprA/Smf involved in DNA uptake
LLRLGATLVRDADDVLESLGIVAQSPRGPGPAVDGRLEPVREAVAAAPCGADEVARRTGLGAPAVAAALAELEVLGVVAQADGVYRQVMRATSATRT